MTAVPSPRSLDLVEVALDAAAQACQAGASLRRQRDLDPTAREYLVALDEVQRWRKEAGR